jgi:hypothetical protein
MNIFLNGLYVQGNHFYVCAEYLKCLDKINKTKHRYVFMHIILELFVVAFNLGNLEL